MKHASAIKGIFDMKIVTICGCGLGTCFILKLTTEKALEALGIKAEVVPCDLGCAQSEQGDIYIAPYGMENEFVMHEQACIAIKNVICVEEVKEKLSDFLSLKR